MGGARGCAVGKAGALTSGRLVDKVSFNRGINQ